MSVTSVNKINRYRRPMLGLAALTLAGLTPALHADTPATGWTDTVIPAPPPVSRDQNPYGYIVPLATHSYVKLSADARFNLVTDRHRAFNTNLGSDNYWQTRFGANADFHLADDNLRTFIELQQTDTRHKNSQVPAAPIDQSDFALLQAFIDVGRKQTRGTGYLRLGRQQLHLDANHWTTTRNGPNVNLTFDGIRGHKTFNHDIDVDAFALREVTPRFGHFNDHSRHANKFYGIYSKLRWNDLLQQDIFVLGTVGQRTPGIGNGPGNAHQNRFGAGTRLYGNYHGLHYDTDMMYQTGKLRYPGSLPSQHISAWAVMNRYGYQFTNTPWQPDLSLRLDVASGDKHAGDRKLNTFDPFYQTNGFWWGNGGGVAFSNLVALGPVITVQPADKVTTSVGALSLWKQQRHDCAYRGGPKAPIAGTCNSDKKRLGDLYTATAAWRVNPHLLFDIEYNYYHTKGAMKAANQSSYQYAVLRTNILF